MRVPKGLPAAGAPAPAPSVVPTRSAGRAVARLAKHLEHALTPLDLSLPQYRVLGILADGSSASSALADQLAVRPPSVTSVINGLVTRGLVERSPHPSDRRRLDLALTADGAHLLAAAEASVRERLEAVASCLPDPGEPDALDRLGRWHDALDEHRARRDGPATGADHR